MIIKIINLNVFEEYKFIEIRITREVLLAK